MEQDNYEDLALIDEYLAGALKGQDLAKFEQRVKADKAFAKEVEVMRSMLGGIEMKKEKELRAIIQQIEEKRDNKNILAEPEPKVIKMKPKKKFNWLALAAALATLVAALIWMNQDTKPTPQEAYAKFYKKETKVLEATLDDLDVFGIGDEDKVKKDELAKALQLYKSDKYQEAADNLEQYLTIHGQDPIAAYYLGNAYMNLSEYGKAVEQLSPLIQLTDFKLLDWSKYYLALSYSMLNTTDGNLNAVTLMNQLTTCQDKEVQALAKGWIEFTK